MKPHRLYIIMCILSLLSFAGCRDEEPVQSAESKRTITVNLGIAMSRVAKEDQVVYGDANDMKVWLFDQTGRCVQYIPVKDPQFTGRDITGDPVESVSTEFDVTDVESLQFRVLLNTDGLEDENGNPLVLGGKTTIDEIDDLTFQFGTTMPDGDNKVPMYGKEKESITIDNKREYNVDIELVRAVGKLELFFTRENENSELTINSIKLEHVPIIGYMAAMPDPAPTGIYTGSEENILSFDSGETSVSILTTSDETLGNFSNDETNFTKLTLTNTYLLENPNGGTWSEVGSNNDYTYPYDEPSASITDQDTRYVMTVDYTIGETGKTQVVYLPAIERNVWNKIFARVKDDGKITFSYRVLFWEKEESQIGWDPESGFGYAYDAPMAAWRIYEKKVDADFRDAREGDEEATVCYVLNPRFGRSDNKSDHNTLVAKSSYAGFYFCMKEPDGAIWKAYLTNPDDFELSTGGAYDSDGDGTNDKHCVITGIAREEPYQIQVGAKKPWTIASEEEGNGFEGEDSGWDVLAPWGEQIENSDEQYDIHTDLYILVSLDQGITWNTLDINRPDFTPTDKTPEENPEGYRYYLEHTYWYNNRRFAGGDDYIRIWQLKAEKGGDFVEMVDKLDEKWAIKAYWKGDDSN